MMTIKGMTQKQVNDYFTHYGFKLNYTADRHGLIEVVYCKVSSGVTVEEVRILFGRHGRAGLIERCSG